MAKSEIVFLSGRKSTEFVEKVYQEITESHKDVKVRMVQAAVDTFKNGELNIKLLDSVRGNEVFLFQQFTQPGTALHEELFELMLLLDTVSRSAATSITICLPFLPYLRQDRKAEGREPISAKVLFNLLKSSASGKLSRIITFDMHNAAEQGFVDLPLDDLPTMNILGREIRRQSWFDLGNTVVLSPDVGSAKKAEKLVSYLGLEDGVAIVNKERRKGERAVAKSIIGNVEGKNIVMIDDIIDSGGTIMGAVDLLREQGAKNVLVLATHGIFSGNAIPEFTEGGIEVVVTDSIPRTTDFVAKNKWLSSISLAQYTSEAIYANVMGNSVHKLINDL